jgi:hypothetical protein
MDDLVLKPWERFVTGMDTANDDGHCIVYGIYDTLTGELRIVGVEMSEEKSA